MGLIKYARMLVEYFESHSIQTSFAFVCWFCLLAMIMRKKAKPKFIYYIFFLALLLSCSPSSLLDSPDVVVVETLLIQTQTLAFGLKHHGFASSPACT